MNLLSKEKVAKLTVIPMPKLGYFEILREKDNKVFKGSTFISSVIFGQTGNKNELHLNGFIFLAHTETTGIVQSIKEFLEVADDYTFVKLKSSRDEIFSFYSKPFIKGEKVEFKPLDEFIRS